MATSRPTLLLLSGSSLVGQNVIQALAAERARFHLVATSSAADAATLQDFDEVHMVPETRQDPAGMSRVVEALIDAAGPSLVIPCRDDDVVFLAHLARRRPEWAPRLLAGSSEAADVLLDKWTSWTFSRDHGLPFAPTLRLDDSGGIEAFVEAHGFPLVLKPRYGFASQGVSLILERAQLEAVPRDSGLLLQKYLGDGAEVNADVGRMRSRGWPLFFSFEDAKCSVQVIIGPDGAVQDVCGTTHVMRQGMSVAVARDERAEVRALGLACARPFIEAGWRGPLNIQCQSMPGDGLGIFEYNGRFTGATAARALLGFDEIALTLRCFAGITLRRLPPSALTRIVRVPASRGLPGEVRERLERTGRYRRDDPL